MDKLDHLLDAQIRELKEETPFLRNKQELTDCIMDQIQAHRSTPFLHRNWVRLILNTAAVGLIVCYFFQTGTQEPSGVTTKQLPSRELLQETQAGKLLRQTTANEALPDYLSFLQQRSRENRAFRSTRPTTKTLTL